MTLGKMGSAQLRVCRGDKSRSPGGDAGGAVTFTALVPQVWPLNQQVTATCPGNTGEPHIPGTRLTLKFRGWDMAVWVFTSPQEDLETGCRV